MEELGDNVIIEKIDETERRSNELRVAFASSLFPIFLEIRDREIRGMSIDAVSANRRS